MTNIKLVFRKECAVSGVLGFVLYVSKIFGLAPLKFKRVRDGWCIRISPAASVFGRTIVCLICFVTLVLLILDFHVEYNLSANFKTKSDTAATIGTVTFRTLSLLAAVNSGTRRMKCVISGLAQLQKVDASLCHYGPQKPFKTPIRFMSVCSFIGLCLLFGTLYSATLFTLVEKKSRLLRYMSDALLYLMLITNKLLILQVTQVLLAVPASFSHLNDCLTNLLRQIRNHNTPSETAATINLLSTIYIFLSGVVNRVDDSHGAVLAALMPVFLSSLVITLYNLIANLFLTSFFGKVIQLLFVIIHLTHMVVIIKPCHLTYQQTNRTKNLISQLLLCTPPEHHEVIHELELFYKHLLNDVLYTPMGIFCLDRTVIVAIVGSITTYLVIMVEP